MDDFQATRKGLIVRQYSAEDIQKIREAVEVLNWPPPQQDISAELQASMDAQVQEHIAQGVEPAELSRQAERAKLAWFEKYSFAGRFYSLRAAELRAQMDRLN